MSAGVYGTYGGRYVPETLIPALDELERGWDEALADPLFREELDVLGRGYVGRPTPLYEARRFAPDGRRILLKREDLCHTGAHKINNALGQIVLANRLGKERIVSETGAGQHGVATATVCARFGLECSWARKTFAASTRTSSACGSSGPRCAPSSSGRRR